MPLPHGARPVRLRAMVAALAVTAPSASAKDRNE